MEGIWERERPLGMTARQVGSLVSDIGEIVWPSASMAARTGALKAAADA
jgi:hypothetical protein